jgi:hypothetical protein
MEDQAEICAELKRLEQQLALLAAEGEHPAAWTHVPV